MRGVALIFRITWNAAPWRTRPSERRPSFARPEESQRLLCSSSGGSETINRPSRRKRRAAHSAVTAGGPNDRAVTNSKPSSSSGNRARTSTRPLMTFADDGEPSQRRTSSRKFVRLTMESTNVALHPQVSSRTSPGSPPPLPRSRNSEGGAGNTSAQTRLNPVACSICVEISAGPKKPRALDSSRARCNH